MHRLKIISLTNVNTMYTINTKIPSTVHIIMHNDVHLALSHLPWFVLNQMHISSSFVFNEKNTNLGVKLL